MVVNGGTSMLSKQGMIKLEAQLTFLVKLDPFLLRAEGNLLSSTLSVADPTQI